MANSTVDLIATLPTAQLLYDKLISLTANEVTPSILPKINKTPLFAKLKYTLSSRQKTIISGLIEIDTLLWTVVSQDTNIPCSLRQINSRIENQSEDTCK